MKATGMIRRVEDCVIIGQTAQNPHKHWAFRWFAPLNALVSKTGFWAVLYIFLEQRNLLLFCETIVFFRIVWYNIK